MRRRFILAPLVIGAFTSLAWAQFPHLGQISAPSCTTVDGTVGVWMGDGTCVEVTEAKVSSPIPQAGATFLNLYCETSADPGAAKVITVTGRRGACGSETNSSLVCTLTGGSGRASCNSGSTSMVLTTAGHCWDLGLTFSAALTTSVQVNCWLERAL